VGRIPLTYRFQTIKSAIKLHTLLDLRGNIPSFLHITDGKGSDYKSLDVLPLEAGSFYIMDRGYIDFARLDRFNRTSAFFVIRQRDNNLFRRKQCGRFPLLMDSAPFFTKKLK
jgi:Transposase DDE domain